MNSILYTPEQKKIFSSKASILNVLAFAGTGKTTTLVELSKIHKDKRILYIAFNESVINEAKNKFPSNVEITTSHSLAYRKFGFKYKNKIKPFVSFQKILNVLFLPKTNRNIILAKKILEGINKFCYSEYLNIEDAYYLIESPLSEQKMKFYLKTIWEKMKSLQSNFPVTHDFYLKLFQLDMPILDFDIILFDEAQDSNPAMKRLILNQTLVRKTKIIFVGDNYQNIYSFRGSINIFNEDILNVETLPLTKSFRFGLEIAGVANNLLSLLNEKNKIIGNKEINSSVNYIDPSHQYTIITRTNAMILGNALRVAEDGKKVFFLDKEKGFNFKKILDIDSLYKNNIKEILNPDIKKFRTFMNLERYANVHDDQELIFMINVVRRHKKTIRESISKLNSLIVKDISQADVVLTTAHKAKGLEFDQVVLSNDFYNPFDKEGKLKQNINTEEINILYVALTRAVYNIYLNKGLNTMMENKYL
jgi:F-box protein 18 (helicase)